jgi:catalase
MNRAPYKLLLRATILSVHKVTARWLTSTRVQHTVKGRVIWEDSVETFELINHAEAKYCFAWSVETAQGTAVLTALKIAPVVSPQTAVDEAFREGKIDPRKISQKK